MVYRFCGCACLSLHSLNNHGRYDGIKQMSEIGRGGFGVVYNAVDRRSGDRLALKVPLPQLGLGPSTLSVDLQKRIAREVALMMKCVHPCVVRCLGLVLGGPSGLAIAMDLCGASLLDLVSSSSDDVPSRQQRLRYLLQAAEAIEFLHAKKIVHRDVKTANLLLDATGSVRLGDFGMARVAEFVSTYTNSTHSAKGTPAYSSPEQLRRGVEVTYASDVYSFGVVCYEVLSLKKPWEGEDLFQILAAVANDRQSVPLLQELRSAGFNDDLVVILNSCLSWDPSGRPTMAEVSRVLASHVKMDCQLSDGAGDEWFARASADDQCGEWQPGDGYRTTSISPRHPVFQEVLRNFMDHGGVKGGPQDQFGITRIDLLDNIKLRERFGVSIDDMASQRRALSLDPLRVGPPLVSVLSEERVRDAVAEKSRLIESFQTLMQCGGGDTGRPPIALLLHGCPPDTGDKVLKGGLLDLRRNDGGYFGSGVYLTPHAAYASSYATGALVGNMIPPNSRGEHTVLLCMVVASHVYPVTRGVDYLDSRGEPTRCSIFHCNGTSGEEERADQALKAGGYSAHVIGVCERHGFESAPDGERPDFMEVVVKAESQVLPLAVLYIKDAAAATAEREAVVAVEDALDTAVRQRDPVALGGALDAADALGIQQSRAYQSGFDALQRLRDVCGNSALWGLWID